MHSKEMGRKSEGSCGFGTLGTGDMIEFRDYQKDIISRGIGILKPHRFLYLAMEVRTGKTLTSLGICENLHIKKVLFITKKKMDHGK